MLWVLEHMTRRILQTGIVILLISLPGCSGDSMSPGSFTVEGFVRNGGLPVRGVSIVIDNAGNWTTVTDSTGYFKIIGVTPAIRTVALSLNGSDGSFSDQKFSVAVRNDVFLSALTIPKLMKLEVDSAYGGRGIRLIWHQTDAPEFRAYRLFRRQFLPLDDNTGTLAAERVDVADTTFADTLLQSGSSYSYRIYAFNELVRVCGSNTVGMIAR